MPPDSTAISIGLDSLLSADFELRKISEGSWHTQSSEAFGKSGLDDPKTPRSNSYVYLPVAVQALLQDWRDWCGDTRPEAFMFPSRRNTPTRYDNFLKRVLKPAAEAVGLEDITHQMLRRSFSTMAFADSAIV